MPKMDSIVTETTVEEKTISRIWKARIWKTRDSRQNGKVTRIEIIPVNDLPSRLLSSSSSYELRYKDGKIIPLPELKGTKELLKLYQEEPFEVILSPKPQSFQGYFLAFDTEWNLDQGEKLIQLSWIVFDPNLKEVLIRDFKDQDFHLPLMQFARDVAEYIPLVMGHPALSWGNNRRSGMDLPALRRLFPGHPAFAVFGAPEKSYDAAESTRPERLEFLKKTWGGSAQKSDALRDCRATFEAFWHRLTQTKA